MTKAVAVSLKIPDNTAYSAAVALRRLGVHVHSIERSEIWLFEDALDERALLERVTADETIFNPNKHRALVLDAAAPRAGEVWIETLESCTSRHPGSQRAAAIGWRLLDARGEALDRSELQTAVERLLCNPAIERALYGEGPPNPRQVEETPG